MKPKTPKKPAGAVAPPPTNAGDTSAEEFLDPESRAVLGMPETFQGIQLAPYSEGVRLMWLNTFGSLNGALMGVAFIWTLKFLQERYEASQLATEDERWAEAGVALMRLARDREAAQFTVIKWAEKLKRAAINEAIKLADAILEAAAQADLAKPDDDDIAGSEDSGGKGQ